MTDRQKRLLGREMSPDDQVESIFYARLSYQMKQKDRQIEHLEIQLRRSQAKARRLQWKLKNLT